MKTYIQTLLFALTVTLFLPSGVQAQGADRMPLYTADGTSACLTCHSGEKMQAMQDGPHGVHETLATPMGEKGCESCHGPGSFHVSRAHGGRGFPNMINFGAGEHSAPRDVQLNSCLECHQEARGEAHKITFTGSPHDTTEIVCASCHAGHVVTDPIIDDMGAQAENCYSCHEDMKTGHNPFAGKSIDLSLLSCSTCHDVHAVMQD